MSTYEALRHIADSYGLAAIVLLWVVLVGWAFRPGAKPRNHAAKHSIFDPPEPQASVGQGEPQ